MNDHFSCPLPNFVGEEDECLPTCGFTNYTIAYADTSKNKKCVRKCVNYGKYYDSIDSTKTWKDTCTNGQFYNSENQCLTTCNSSPNSKLSTENFDYANPSLSIYPCLASTDTACLYYYAGATKNYMLNVIFMILVVLWQYELFALLLVNMYIKTIALMNVILKLLILEKKIRILF